jgi:hypothetical protein
VKQLNKKEAGLYKSMFKALGKGKDEEPPAKADQAGGAAAEPMDAEPPSQQPEAVAV